MAGQLLALVQAGSLHRRHVVRARSRKMKGRNLDFADFPAPGPHLNLSQKVATEIEADIKKGKYRLGQRIPKESELQATYGVGRGTVREALVMLKQKGCLESRRGMHGGTFVREQDHNSILREIIANIVRSNITIDKVIEFRQAFDSALYWSIIKNITDEDIVLLHQKTDELQKYINNTVADAIKIFELDLEIYKCMANCAHNSLINALLDVVMSCFGHPTVLAEFDSANIQKLRHDWADYLASMINRDYQRFNFLLYRHYEEIKTMLVSLRTKISHSLAKRNNHAKETETAISISSRLQEMIFNGHYGVGDRLPSERELQSQFGVGRTTIREALRMLQQKGWIASRRGTNGGTFVQEVRMENIRENMLSMMDFSRVRPRDFLHFRLFFDIMMFDIFTRNYEPEDKDQLCQILAEMERAATDTAPNMKALGELSLQLCRKCFELSKNQILLWIYDQIRSQFGYEELLVDLDMASSEFLADWSDYIDALTSHDLHKYVYLTYKHYDGIRQVLESGPVAGKLPPETGA